MKQIFALMIAVTALTAQAADNSAKQESWIWAGKEAVRTKLKDGNSAKFQNTYFNRGKDGVPMSCGQVNSKNSFGAYGGFQRYISAGKPELTFLEEQVTDFHAVWNRFCK
jgi:hypothetical protein